MKIKTLALVACGAAVLGVAHAAKVPLYDDFNGNGIDRAKWNETESARYVDDKGRLLLGRDLLGSTASNVGTTDESFNLNMANTAPAKTLKATITVTNVHTDEVCAANTTPTQTAARLIGSFFNIRPGGPQGSDRTGDVLAQFRLRRASNTTDAPGVMQVQGVVSACSNADCSVSSTIGSALSFGTVNLNTAVIGQVAWDKKNNKFTFTRDSQPAQSVVYTDDDSMAPAVAFNNVSIRNQIANCTAGAIKGGTVAVFDNIGLAP
jgi:hypothetical protein